MRRRLSVLLLSTLGSCSHVPVSTMWAMRNFNAATVDPASLRAAIRIPEALQPQPGGVTLTAGWRREGAEPHEEKFVLQETTEASDVAPLREEDRAGTRIYVYRVDPADYAKIRAVQREAIEEKARHPGKSSGSFGVGADACRRGDLPDGPVAMTTYLRVQPSDPYLTVLKDVDLREAVTKEKPLDALVPPCEKFANRAESGVAAN